MKSARSLLTVEFALLCLGAVSLAASTWMAYMAVTSWSFWDFDVFYSSAKATLGGWNIYRTYGPAHLPYWYFPWLAWFFVPFALLSYPAAKTLYIALSLVSLGLMVWVLGKALRPQIPLGVQLLAAGMSLLMSMLLFIAGQLDFILAGAITAIVVLLERKRGGPAGLLFPLLLFKPHLLAVFIPFLFLRGGRRFALAALGSTAFLGVVGLLIAPGWPSEMLRMLTHYGGRSDNNWNFITLAQLLGSQENWSGTANLPITISLLVICLAVVWSFRKLPIVDLLALSLAASMVCAPRAYTYNLPVLILPMLWISSRRPSVAVPLWLGAGVVAIAAKLSTGAYLIVIAVFALSVVEARRILIARQTSSSARP